MGCRNDNRGLYNLATSQPFAMPHETNRQSSISLGATYTTLSVAAVAIMAALVKWASHGFSSEFLLTVRWAAGLAVFVVYYVLCSRMSLVSQRWRKQIFIAIAWTLGVFLYYLSVRYIPLMDATLLLFTSSLFAPLLAVVFGHQREPRLVWIGSAIGFAGVLLVLRPGLGVFQPMSLVALMSGMLMAVRIFLSSSLGDEPKQRTTFYSLAIGLVVCLVILAADGFQVARPAWQKLMFSPSEIAQPWFVDSSMIAAVIVLGALSTLQPLFTTWGLQYASVAQISPFRYSAVIIAAAIDYVVWNHVPSWTSVGGMLLIAGGAMLIIASRRQSPAGSGSAKH